MLSLAIALLFGRAVTYGFIQLDDDVYVTANPHVQAGLTADSVRWAFTTFTEGHYHPLVWLSHMAVAERFGMAPAAHHAVNLVLHALDAVLLYGLLAFATRAPWPSLAAAALWALHPLRVEAVVWVTARKDSLSTLFLLAALLFYVLYARRVAAGRGALSRLGPAALVMACFALGLLCKPMVITLPALLLLLDVWPLGRLALDGGVRAIGRRLMPLVLEKLPLAPLVVAQAVLAMKTQEAAGAVQELPLVERLANAAVSYLAYLGQNLLPWNLSIFYPLHPVRPGLLAASLLALGVLTHLVLRIERGERERPVLVGWLLFLVSFLPIIGLVQIGGQSMADRYSYVPSMGLCVAVSFGVARAAARRVEAGRLTAEAARSRVLLLFTSALAAAAIATQQRVTVWRSSEALFTDALLVDSDNFFIHNNLGFVLDQEGRLAEAESHYREAVRLHPTYPLARINLGVVLARRGDYNAALDEFKVALARQPRNANALYSTGLTLARLGRYPEAVDHYRRALEVEPENAMTHYSLGAVLLGTGRREEGAAHLRRAAELRPGWDEPLAMLRGR